MAEITDEQLRRALRRRDVQLMPAPAESDSVDITGVNGVAFACSPGQWWTISVTADSFLATHATAATASATSFPLPKGLWGFVVPNGVTSFAIFSATGSARGKAYRS